MLLIVSCNELSMLQSNRCLNLSASQLPGSLRVLLATKRDQAVKMDFCMIFLFRLAGARLHQGALSGEVTRLGGEILVTRGLVARVLERLQAPPACSHCYGD